MVKKRGKKPEPKTVKLTSDDTIRNLQNQMVYQQNLIGKLYVELNFANEVLQQKQAEIEALRANK